MRKESEITYLIDENVMMSDEDINNFNSCKVLNSLDFFDKGTPDEKITNLAKDNGWFIVTKDIRMALRSLIDNVPVIFISDHFKSTHLLTAISHGSEQFPEMFDYIYKRFGYEDDHE